jgi:hypothetical protein
MFALLESLAYASYHNGEWFYFSLDLYVVVGNFALEPLAPS